MLKPRFRFQNIKGIQSMNFALSRGIQPSACTVHIPYSPEFSISREPSELLISDTERTVRFRDCVVEEYRPSISESGEKLLQITIVDRRWRWQFGQVSGSYNYPEILLKAGQAAELQASTQTNDKKKKKKKKQSEKIVGAMSLRDLCQGLLDEMGEKQYDVSRVPDDVYPFVNWEVEVPAAALDELCQQNNLHIVLTHRDTVEIWPTSQTNGGSLNGIQGLPNLPSSSASFGSSKGTVPDSVAVTTAPHMYQLDFRLKAMGKARDGKFYPIERLPYIPKVTKIINGQEKQVFTWENSDPRAFRDIPDETNRKLALDSMYKYYAIEVTPSTFTPGITSNQQYELLDHQLSVVLIEATKELFADFVNGERVIKERLIPPQIESVPQFAKKQPVRRKPEIFGQFYDEKGGENNNVEEFNPDGFLTHDLNTDANRKLRYTKGFDIDNEKKMVVFSDPIFRIETRAIKRDRLLDPIVRVDGKPKNDPLNREEKEFAILPADIRLRVAYTIKDLNSRAPYRLVKVKPIVIPSRGTLTHYVTREDIEPFDYIDPFTGQPTDNLKEVEKQADYYLEIEANRFKPQQTADATYPMALEASPDGLRAQVVWSIELGSGIRTAVSVGEELIANLAKYEDRRKMQLLARTLRFEQIENSKPPKKDEPKRIDQQ